MAILETGHAVQVSTVQRWLAQPSRLAKTMRICLPHKDISDDTASLLSALTLQCCNLQMLQLPGNRIGDHGVSCLAESLKLLSASLQILDLSDNCLSGVGAKKLARMFFGCEGGAAPRLQVKPRFRLLDLSKNKLDDHGVAGVARNIAAGKVLAKQTLLRLQQVGCSSQGLADFAGCHLAGLDIGYNALGLDGARTLLAARRRNRWQSLRMSCISDGAKASEPLSWSALAARQAGGFDCLEKGLNDFECNGNHFGENACCCLAENMSKWIPTLRRLALSSTGVGLRACGALGQGLWPGAGLASLKILDLSNNQLIDVSVELLCNGLSRCISLQEVQLSHNAIGSRGSIVLAGALQAQRRLAMPPHTGIKILGLSGNPVGDGGAKAIAAAAAASTQDPRCLGFEASWGLEQLDLACTQVGLEGCDALAGAVAARAALADKASRRLAEIPSAELLERCSRLHPTGLTVLGLDQMDVSNAEVAEMLRTACCRMAAHWPTSQAVVSSWLSLQDDIGDLQDSNLEADELAQKEVGLGHIKLDEFYFSRVFKESDPMSQKPISSERAEQVAHAKSDVLGETVQDGSAGVSSTQQRAAPAKSKGKSTCAKGMGPPPKGKGRGSNSSAKGKGKGKEAKEREEGKAKGTAPFGRRMHWVQPQYQQPEHDTVFGDADAAFDLDTDALASLLNGTRTNTAPKSRASQHKKPEGIKVLDASRAQNIAIVLSKLPVSSEDVCEALGSLDFSRLALSDDMVELLTSVLPTPEETQKLQSHKDCPEQLRDIEQKVLPFCFLPRATARLRLFRFAASHAESAATYLQRCRTLDLAAMEVKSSQELRKVLALILRIGNYINHGMKDMGGGACAFSIETLAAITSFRLGSMSTLQFLCVTFRRANPGFLDALQMSLKDVQKAAREKSVHLKSCIQAFQKEVDFAEREVSLMPEDQLASEVTSRLLQDLHAEALELENSLAIAFGKCDEVQEYLCTSEDKATDAAPPPYENLFLHLSDFLESFQKAWKETEPVPSQKNRLPSKQKTRQQREPSEKLQEGVSSKIMAKASLPICRRAYPDPKEPVPGRESAKSLRQVDAAQELVSSTHTKQGPFWAVDLDVEALLSDIFANDGDEEVAMSEATPGSVRDHSRSFECTSTDQARKKHLSGEPCTEVREDVDVDDLIDSIFD
ncbi:FH3 [Symbiodinium sp. CCMP2456]|nr:FH3 [Symbiodinium sp. CCMP2456]